MTLTEHLRYDLMDQGLAVDDETLQELVREFQKDFLPGTTEVWVEGTWVPVESHKEPEQCP